MVDSGCKENPKNDYKRRLDAHFKSEKLIAERNNSERKAVFNSFVNRLHIERKEAETEAACTRAKESQGWRAEEVKQEDFLAREMMKDKLRDLNDMKLRDYLRNSEELKELERKLRTAYIQRDLAVQLVEKKAETLKKKCQENEEVELLKKQEKLYSEFDKVQKEEHFLKKIKYKEDLQDQLIDRQKLKEFEYKNQLEEKALIEDALRTILEEDKKEEELKLYKKVKAKEDTEAMIKAKQSWMILEKKTQEEEERKIKEYLEEKTKRERELQEEIKRKEEQKLRQKAACIEKIKSNEEERLERERITQILMDEDSRLKEEERVKKDHEKKLKTYLEQKEVTARQIEFRIKAALQEKEEDLQFIRKIIEDNERALKCEREEMLRKRTESIEHGKQLRHLIEMQNIQKIKEMERNYLEELRQLELQKQRQELLAEERLKLLNEHVKNLIGFLPRGVLNKEDLPHLDPEVQKYYKVSK